MYDYRGKNRPLSSSSQQIDPIDFKEAHMASYNKNESGITSTKSYSVIGGGKSDYAIK